MPKDIIVIGASAGGIEALRVLVKDLPGNIAASLFVVVHTSPESPKILHEILERAGSLPAQLAQDREQTSHGRIYVAQPDHHLLLEPGLTILSRGPKENRFRPAIDPLFRSAAQAYGPRVIGVILTGGLDDGTAGLLAIKRLNGTAVVQDPREAENPSMPRSALKHVKVDYCVPLKEIAPLLVSLSRAPVVEEGAIKVPEDIDIEVKIAKEASSLEAGILKLGEPSVFSCPECHGVLLQMSDEGRSRFRCHTGHAYSVQSLMAAINEAVEEALWNAIRSIEENILLMHQLAGHVRESEDTGIAEEFLEKARNAERQADLVRNVVMNLEE